MLGGKEARDTIAFILNTKTCLRQLFKYQSCGFVVNGEEFVELYWRNMQGYSTALRAVLLTNWLKRQLSISRLELPNTTTVV